MIAEFSIIPIGEGESLSASMAESGSPVGVSTSPSRRRARLQATECSTRPFANWRNSLA